jgi:3-oxoacyl-[acyl-carrier protein] reductase
MHNTPVRNVIVTGGSRGLGLAIVTTLAAAGYQVIAIARNETEELRAAAATAARERRGAVAFRSFDLAKTGEIAGLVGDLRKQFGPLYGLVNNAGIGTAGVLTIMRDEQIESLLRLNTLAPILLTKYVVRSMMVERAGRIVSISSIVASTGYSGLSAYSATKASLVGFTRSLAREVGQLGITVNTVAPGFVDTEMTHDLGGGQREQIMRRSALRRMAEAQDVAGSVEFLLSEKGKNITGITLTVDAGNTA